MKTLNRNYVIFFTYAGTVLKSEKVTFHYDLENYFEKQCKNLLTIVKNWFKWNICCKPQSSQFHLLCNSKMKNPVAFVCILLFYILYFIFQHILFFELFERFKVIHFSPYQKYFAEDLWNLWNSHNMLYACYNFCVNFTFIVAGPR